MRLIDADVLIEEMKKTETEYEKEMTCPSWWSAFNVISEQPTAYDVDKVVEELEKATQYIKIDGKPTSVKAIHPAQAIEIVKHGGVSDDVCEWHCDMYGRWHTKCHTLADNDPLEYTYCPYCGKKIKVVE